MSEQQFVPGTWRIDPANSVVGFSVRHMMVSRVRGRFERFDATLTVPEEPLRSTVRVAIDASSINTDNSERDAYIRSADFFDAAEFPEWTFVSTGAREAGGDLLLTGDLTVRGTTHRVELTTEFTGAASDADGRPRIGFRARSEISRRDFGVDVELPMDGGGVVVGDKVRIEIDAEFNLQKR